MWPRGRGRGLGWKIKRQEEGGGSTGKTFVNDFEAEMLKKPVLGVIISTILHISLSRQFALKIHYAYIVIKVVENRERVIRDRPFSASPGGRKFRP